MTNELPDDLQEGYRLWRNVIRRRMKACGVPESLQGGLERYLVDRILPGGFLQAVLFNNMAEAVRRADPINQRFFAELILFLDTTAADEAWGSRDNVLAWTTTPDRLEL